VLSEEKVGDSFIGEHFLLFIFLCVLASSNGVRLAVLL
jgi:hypothetical protein